MAKTMMKRCSKCEVEQLLAAFSKRAVSWDGLQYKCKGCCKKAKRNYQQTPKGRASCKRSHTKFYSTVKGYLCNTFKNMGQRCNDPKNNRYKWYGGRGISVKFESLDDFRNYVMGVLQVDPRGLQIDRIDNDGDYEKGNIRFVTRKENMRRKEPLDD